MILNNGSDGATSESWAFGAAAALERGWHAITFDGPGQNAALFRQQLHFRPDWEAVITPVVDFLVQRPGVDADLASKIACPLLITAPEHEQFWPGQSAELHAMVSSSTLVDFTEAEGADWHCQPAAHALTTERVFNWLESILA